MVGSGIILQSMGINSYNRPDNEDIHGRTRMQLLEVSTKRRFKLRTGWPLAYPRSRVRENNKFSRHNLNEIGIWHDSVGGLQARWKSRGRR